MTHALSLFLAVAIALAVDACGGARGPATTSAPSPQPSLAAGYPEPQNGTAVATPQQGYPGPTTIQTTEPTAVSLPSPDPNLGSATGVLQLRGKPVANVAVYLAPVLKDNAGQESIVALDLVTSPWSTTASDGQFDIVNVEPGRYGLILVTTQGSYRLLYPDQSENLIITISQGQPTDLGLLNYDSLPIQVP